MHKQLFSFIVSIFVTLSLQSIINFTNPTSTTQLTQQQCSDGGYVDFCCTPLDIDLGDGKGFGWFYPEQASLLNLGSKDVFSAVYRNDASAPGPCYGDAAITKTTHRNWDSPVFKQSPYISGVLVQKSNQPIFARKRTPNAVVVDGRAYVWDGVVREPMLFKDFAGNTIRGQAFDGAVGLNQTQVSTR